MATERYFVGPTLLTDIRSTIARVQGMPTSESGGHQKGMFIPLTPPLGEGGFRMATFTGSWSVSSNKTVTLYNANQTLTATNLLLPIPELSNNTNSPTVCAIGQDRGTWYLLNIVHTDADVLTGVTLQPTRLEFGRKTLASINATISTTGISITECDNEAASAEQLNWFFG